MYLKNSDSSVFFDVVHVYWLIEYLYSAHIHSIECSWRLADVLACSQKVSHPEMRLVSAAIGASFPFSLFENFGASWLLYVSTILWLMHRDCRIFMVRAWCSECVHTLDLGLSSHPKDSRVTSPKFTGISLSIRAGELSENSLIAEIFVSTSEKIRQVFLLNAYAFRDFLILRLNFQRFFYTVFSTLVLLSACVVGRWTWVVIWARRLSHTWRDTRTECLDADGTTKSSSWLPGKQSYSFIDNALL
jgi:hypothetical protein